HPPVDEELPAAHGVAEVGLPVVFRVGVTHRGRAPALGHHGVGLTEQCLAHHGDPQTALAGFDHRAQTRAAGTDHHDVVLVPLDFSHNSPFVGYSFRSVVTKPDVEPTSVVSQ